MRNAPSAPGNARARQSPTATRSCSTATKCGSRTWRNAPVTASPTPPAPCAARCMKTCPWNIEGVLSERPFLWAAMNLPFTRGWIARLDDAVGNGLINPVKKWWWDLDTDAEGNIIPAERTNRRQFSKRTNMDPEKQSMGCYPSRDSIPAGCGTAGHPAPEDRGAEIQNR